MLEQFGALWFFSLPILIVAGLVFILIRSHRKTLARWNKLVGLTLIGFLLLPCLPIASTTLYTTAVELPREREQILRDSDAIIQALNRFKTDKGYYPNELKDLEPDYLKSVPTQPGGYPYKYTELETGFDLRYAIPAVFISYYYLVCEYSSKDQATHCDS